MNFLDDSLHKDISRSQIVGGGLLAPLEELLPLLRRPILLVLEGHHLRRVVLLRRRAVRLRRPGHRGDRRRARSLRRRRRGRLPGRCVLQPLDERLKWNFWSLPVVLYGDCACFLSDLK